MNTFLGACVGLGPEDIDEATVAAARLAVESRASSFAPPPAGAPELVGVDSDRAAELGELVAGTRPGRTTQDEITLYKSVGVAVQDAAAAALVLASARERGKGREIELEDVTV
jgi:ornithine cyclodeaminase/alanine dehydrogenase-like protein (mu-crystallin family)